MGTGEEKQQNGQGKEEKMWSISRKDLWRYCTDRHCQDMLLSFKLFGENDWPESRVIGCLYMLSNHKERYYKKIRIPKKGGGTRTLLAPDPLLKLVQKNLLHHVLEGFSVAPCAMAYRRQTGKDREKQGGIMGNAAAHVGKKLVLKLDIADFFGSITFPMVLHHVFPAKYFPPAVGNLLTALCCYEEYLPQGAPTSPAISNLVMKPFDEHMEKWCQERKVSYSRYCDDMTFSGEFDVAEVRKKAESFLNAMGFALNEKKIRILSQKNRQTVTGLTVNEKVQVPKEYRQKLRQELYYCRKFGVEEHMQRQGDKAFLFPEGGWDEKRYLQTLLGRVGFVRRSRPGDKWFEEAEKWVRMQLKLTEFFCSDPKGNPPQNPNPAAEV